MTGEHALDGRAGWIASVRAGLSAGSVCGLLVGLADGVAAAFLTSGELGFASALGCIAAAILQYSLVFGLGLAALGLVLHPLVRRRTPPERYRLCLALGLALAFFAALYWWTRPYVFSGRPSLGPHRLGAAAVFALVALALGFVAARGVTRLGRGAQVALATLVTTAWLGGGIYLAAQVSVGAGRGVASDRNQDLPNVVLVVIDALRQDVLGCYGNTTVKTPNIDRLAREGVVFENAFVQAPYTWTSFGSLLTGKYPRRHGLIKMRSDMRMLPTTTLPLHLKRGLRADGRQLTADDVITASFHTGALRREQGLLEGFDLVFEETAGHELADLASPWSLYRRELLLWVFKNRLAKRFDSGLLASEACRWIESIPGKRFMTMVHLFSTHTPYAPPREFREMYCDPAYSGPIRDAFDSDAALAIERGDYHPTAADAAQIRALYHGGVSHADMLVGRLLDSLAKSGALANTLVIVTSDHGESLGEDGLWEHNHLVRRELRVPLVMSWPGHLPEGKRVSALVDEIDVFPTVCELAGLALPAPTSEREVVDGTSLMPLVRGEVQGVREHSYAENGPAVSVQDLTRMLTAPRAALGEATPEKSRAAFELDLAQTKNRLSRYVEYAGASTDERDVIAERRAEALALYAILDTWSRALPIAAWAVLESHRDAETREALIRAGYTGDGDDDAPPPPKEKAAGPR